MKLSAGIDGISYRLLKETGNGVIYALTSNLNASIQKGQVSDEWKTAVVSPICKGSKEHRTKPSNCWPISLTSCTAIVWKNP